MNSQQVMMPATDILEREDGFHIFIDIPGIAIGDLSIDLEQNELTIRGASTYDVTAGQKLRMEFGALRYERMFTLSDMVDRVNIKAVVKDGVLELFLPKAEAMKPKRIEIKVE